jgi:hypothetical protein
VLERAARGGAALSRATVLDRAPPALARAVAPALDDADEIVRILCEPAPSRGPPAPPGEASMLEIALARFELTLGLVVVLLGAGHADPWLLDALARRAVASGTLARGILGLAGTVHRDAEGRIVNAPTGLVSA